MFDKTIFLILLFKVLTAATSAASSQLSVEQKRDNSTNIFIIGGHEVEITDYPYQASIQMFGHHHCGGAIIGVRAILTAAHCVSAFHESILSVRVGSSKVSSGGVIMDIEARNVHPDFNKSPADYDIGVLILTKNLNFSNAVQPIKLQRLPTLPGERASVSGWGKTEDCQRPEHLRAAEVRIANQAKCFADYEEAGYKMTDRMLCAGIKQGGYDACQGDSGGPLICKFSKRLCGIVSFGKGCALDHFPGIYTKVSKLRKWIMQFL